MKDIFLILPVHLFKNIDELKNKQVYIIEDNRYFKDFKYHKLKLAFHRATMKKYYDFLQDKNIDVEYIDNQETLIFYKKKIKNKIFIYEIGDNILENRLKKYYSDIIILPSLNFLVNKYIVIENKNIFYKNNKYNFMNFYKWQRKRLDILMQDDKPLNGKWNFDSENRSKLPKKLHIEEKTTIINNKYTKESIEYINIHFPNNYGSLDYFIYPIDHDSTLKHLKKFIKNKFENFAKYEDAISNKYDFIFHSVLSPMMNIGLITDLQVIKYILKYKNKISFNNIEAIIRQIIGWRNYMYTIYLLEGDKNIKLNCLDHTNIINKDILWNAKTGIQPIDDAIKQLINYGYVHHITRLMVLGNFLLLCQVHPDQVYELFMEWSIDGYAWVMMTNIYGMSQYADGGKIMTRIYISSSNYIIKMSNDYKKSDKWANIFDSLYYRFIDKHKLMLVKNYATAISVKLLNKKKDIKKLIDIGDNYINLLSI